MIGIIDYGMGNIHSVIHALKRLNVECRVSSDRNVLANCDGLLLPGVGAFPDAMKALKDNRLDDFIIQQVNNGKPLIGICLGMQLLFEKSEEGEPTKGLGLLPGRVERFPGVTRDGEPYKVPHMGWNKLMFHKPESSLLKNVDEGYVYFVHSYFVRTDTEEALIATSEYDHDVPAIVGRGKVYGAQFHPEKSSDVGLAILKNFSELVQGEIRVG